MTVDFKLNLVDKEKLVVEVLDSIMSSGKTEGVIRWMKERPQEKFLYISPMLSEVEERIPDSCESLEFSFPNTEQHKTKSAHLLEMLEEGRNVAFTHSLFTQLTRKHLREIRKQQYIMVVDEEVDFIEAYKGRYNRGDIRSLEEAGHIRVDDDNMGKITWLWNDMEDGTQYAQLKRLCELNMLYCSGKGRELLITQLPTALIEYAKRTIILSYLFSGSVMHSFLKLHGVEVVEFNEVELTKTTKDVLSRAKHLITLCETLSTRKISSYSLSNTWYTTNATKEQRDNVGSAIRSVLRKEGRENVLLTLPKSGILKYDVRNPSVRNKRCVTPKDMNLEDIFLYSSARATNLYADKTVALHIYNRYVNTVIMGYLKFHGGCKGAIPDEDVFALSEMVQWLYRTAIRKDEPINVYIVSNRMRNLLQMWLNGEINPPTL